MYYILYTYFLHTFLHIYIHVLHIYIHVKHIICYSYRCGNLKNYLGVNAEDEPLHALIDNLIRRVGGALFASDSGEKVNTRSTVDMKHAPLENPNDQYWQSRIYS